MSPNTIFGWKLTKVCYFQLDYINPSLVTTSSLKMQINYPAVSGHVAETTSVNDVRALKKFRAIQFFGGRYQTGLTGHSHSVRFGASV